MSEENLLKNKYPQLLKEWDYEKNKDIDVNTISFSSHKRVFWLCLNNTEHNYDTSVNNKTNVSLRGVLPGCKKCFHDSVRLQDEILVNNYRNDYKQVINVVKIGDATEKYVENLLLSMDYYQNVTNLGNIGANADISVMYQNITYYLQVKTITYMKDDIYYMTNNCSYPDNMLIIMVNNDRNRYALEFAGNIIVKRLCLTFNYNNAKYKNIMYTDLDKFKNKLKELIILSCMEFNFNGECNKKEYLMLERFKRFCVKNNIIYIRNPTNGDSVDGTINGYKFQAKYVTLNYNNTYTYQIDSTKGAGKLNGASIKRNYDVGDFDYIIIEVGGVKNDESKYENNFCIIPSCGLIEQNILKSDTCKGKKGFSICPPDYPKKHWSKMYWNNIPKELY